MNPRTLLVLAALVVGLCVVLILQKEEQAQATRPEERVFTVDANSVTRIDVEHLERAIRVGLECDAAGRWWMTEPVAYPADSAAVRMLLQLLASLRGIPVEDPDPVRAGLDPPRAVLLWRAGDKQGRLEVGADDVDGARCFARADGERILSVGRHLASSLDLNPNDYRDRRVTPIPARGVISFKRTGSLIPDDGEEERDLMLSAQLDPEKGWVSQTPRLATLDPVQMGFLVRGAAELRAAGFQADDVTDLAHFGLDPPRLRIELEDERGDKAALRFGCFEEGPVRVNTPKRWFACREGYPFVWSVDHRAVGLLSAPRDELYDALVVRASREELVRLEIGDFELNLRTDGWYVTSPDGVEYRAGEGQVEDLQAAITFARIESFNETAEFPEPTSRVIATLKDGRRLGGEVAEVGDAGLFFRRLGDDLVGRFKTDLFDVIKTDPASLRSTALLKFYDTDVLGAIIREGDREVAFERPRDKGVWYVQGTEVEAQDDFYRVLEGLLHLKAKAWAEVLDEVDTTATPIVVTFKLQGDVEHIVELVPTTTGKVLALPDAVVDPALVEAVRALVH